MERRPIDIDALRSDLGGLWRRIDMVDQTGSTNADLLTRAAAGERIDGAVLMAEYQTAGRGRHGRHWTAPPRSQIALSAGVGVPDVPAEAWGWLPLLTGVALVDALENAAGVAAGLKWPNDVLAGDRKLAGILAEVAAPEPVIVVGLGLNVTMTAEEAPDPLATSLAMLGSAPVDRTALAGAVLRALAGRVTAWRTARGADEDVIRDYRSRSLTLGTRVRAFLPGDRAVEGTAADIDGLGRLRIDTGAETITVSAGDITHLRPAP